MLFRDVKPGQKFLVNQRVYLRTVERNQDGFNALRTDNYYPEWFSDVDEVILVDEGNPPEQVIVKIAVAVDPKGHWNASGWSLDGQDHSNSAMDVAVDGVADAEARFWITTVLPVPKIQTVGQHILTVEVAK